MKIETITYKRVKNLGNYQTETFEATASLNQDEKPEWAAEKLKAFVDGQLYPPQVEPDIDGDGLPDRF